MQWCGSILSQVHSGVYAVCNAGWDWGGSSSSSSSSLSFILHYTQHVHHYGLDLVCCHTIACLWWHTFTKHFNNCDFG